jgi:hypothetical protein
MSDKIKLDVCCGQYKIGEDWVGLDKRNCAGVDIVHNAQDFPYPLKVNSCSQINFSLSWACIEPKYRIDLMNEFHRILEPGGKLYLRETHTLSPRMIHDPLYYTGANETTFLYFDPAFEKYKVYEPSPWRILGYESDYRTVVDVLMETVK